MPLDRPSPSSPPGATWDGRSRPDYKRLCCLCIVYVLYAWMDIHTVRTCGYCIKSVLYNAGNVCVGFYNEFIDDVIRLCHFSSIKGCIHFGVSLWRCTYVCVCVYMCLIERGGIEPEYPFLLLWHLQYIHSMYIMYSLSSTLWNFVQSWQFFQAYPVHTVCLYSGKHCLTNILHTYVRMYACMY